MGHYAKNCGETDRMFVHMDNDAYRRDEENGTELKEVRLTSPKPQTTTNGSSTLPSTSKSTGTGLCRPEVCQAARLRNSGPDLRGNPWSKRKTLFLSVTASCFTLWIVIYVTLASCGVL